MSRRGAGVHCCSSVGAVAAAAATNLSRPLRRAERVVLVHTRRHEAGLRCTACTHNLSLVVLRCCRHGTNEVNGAVSGCVMPWAKAPISAMTVSTRYCSSGLQNGGEWQCGSSAGGGCNDSAFGSVEEQRSDRLDRGRVMEDDDDDAGWDASPSSSDAFSTSASPVPLPPQSDPTAASERAALDQRRRLFAQCSELADVVQEELRAEVARDMKDGVTAVPPLAPSGWQVLHTTGSSYFTMSRLKKGSYVDSRASGWRPDHDDDSPQVASDVLPRYRSVHDLVTGGRHRPHSANHEDTAAERGEMWALHRGRYTAAQEEEAASKRSGPTDDEGGRGQDGSGRHRNAVRYARSDMHITLFAPFRSLDLTLHDPRVDICEWTRFDVLIRKERPKAAMVASSPAPTLAGQEGVWDEGRCMFLRLACANSELRVRSLQFVSNKLARGLEEHAVFGKGEPLYLEMLRRLPINVSFQQRSGSTLENKAQSSTMSAASPVNVFDAPEPTPVTPAAAARRTASSFNSAHVLTSQFDRSGEYARTFAYAGPCITELSKELREALSEYVMMDVGITNEVAEYVCQLQFFLEQEEYVGWLAQWGQLAATLKQTL